MTASDRRFQVNEHVVASDIVDNEAVIINLSNGMYFTLDRVGAELWQLLGHPRSADGIATIIASRYEIAKGEVLRDVSELVDELLREDLILAADAAAGTDGDGGATLAPRSGAYAKPVLAKYADMNEVLALDPPLPELIPDSSKRS